MEWANRNDVDNRFIKRRIHKEVGKVHPVELEEIYLRRD
jgi:hypothetical protein